MQDEQLRYSFEDKFKEDLTTYLQGKQLVDNMLPDITDMEDKWLGIAEAYLPDGMREFANYPTVSLGWMMYIGMAIAKYWDEDWGLYSKVENLYTYLRDRIDYDHMDDYICEKVLLLSTEEHKDILAKHKLYGTGTTARLITEKTGLTVKGYNSGPLGGDQQIGARIVEGKIDFVIFFTDPLTAAPHDPDVKALLRIVQVYDVPMAINKSSADFIITVTW